MKIKNLFIYLNNTILKVMINVISYIAPLEIVEFFVVILLLLLLFKNI